MRIHKSICDTCPGRHDPRLRSDATRARAAGLLSIIALLASAAGPSTAHGAPVPLYGTSGDDVLDVHDSPQPYAIYGLAGSDRIVGSSQDDVLDGGSGNDFISGGLGSDTLIGGPGHDYLDGDAGDDDFIVSGWSGWETIAGGDGIDRLLGSDKDDSFGIRSLTSIEIISGGAGYDRLRLAGGTASSLDLSAVTLVGIELIEGSSSKDTIRGSSGADVISGGRGDDRIDGGPGADEVLYALAYAAYVVTINSDDSITVRDTTVRGSDTDTLISIETVTFLDGHLRSGVFTPNSGASTDPLAERIAAAPPGSWLRINNNKFKDVWPTVAQIPATPGYINPAKVIFAWSSMAWDPNRDQLIFWGGGHANYSGNEVYRFDTTTFTWQRASMPSDMVNLLGDNQWFAVDGPMNAPTSSHTYDNQEFLPNLDRFITFGGAKFNARQQFVLEDGTTRSGPYLWDPSRSGPDAVGGTPGSQVQPGLNPSVTAGRMWQNRNAIVVNGIATERPSGDWVNSTSAYVNINGKDAVLITEAPRTRARLFLYTIHDVENPSLDTWELMGSDVLGYGNQGAGAYDPVRKLYARTAKTSIGWGLVVWDLSAPGSANKSFFVIPRDSQGLPIVTDLHGMDFDQRRGVFTLWDGGPEVWQVRPAADPRTGVWQTTAAAIAASPESPTQSDGTLVTSSGSIKGQRGVLGKWKYAADYDVFFGVINPTEGNVWVFKPAN